MSVSRLNGFLAGVTVLDLSHYLPGPLASLMLADMGATVIKIEPPGGDAMRLLGPRGPNDEPVYYQAINAGKESRILDLKDAADHAVFLDLVGDADILIEGFRPGVMARLGLDDARLADRNPRLIRCSISGYGADSPLAQVAGHDGNYLAAAGTLHRNGPDLFDPPVADCAGGLFAALAILGALQGRARDGQGCHIDLALADSIMPLQLFAIAGLDATGRIPAPRDNYLNGGAAYYRTYVLADGSRAVLGAVEAKFWRTFCDSAGHPEWLDRQAEPMPQDDLEAAVQDMFGALDARDCAERFADPDCCVSVALDLEQALISEHVRDRGLVRRAPGGALQALFPAIVDGERPGTRPPLQGTGP